MYMVSILLMLVWVKETNSDVRLILVACTCLHKPGTL